MLKCSISVHCIIDQWKMEIFFSVFFLAEAFVLTADVVAEDSFKQLCGR